jgi:hypothetical protein
MKKIRPIETSPFKLSLTAAITTILALMAYNQFGYYGSFIVVVIILYGCRPIDADSPWFFERYSDE